MTLELDCQDILEIFAYHPLCDSVIVKGTDENNNETGGGIKTPLKRSVFNPNSLAYRHLRPIGWPTNGLARWEHWLCYLKRRRNYIFKSTISTQAVAGVL